MFEICSPRHLFGLRLPTELSTLGCEIAHSMYILACPTRIIFNARPDALNG